MSKTLTTTEGGPTDKGSILAKVRSGPGGARALLHHYRKLQKAERAEDVKPFQVGPTANDTILIQPLVKRGNRLVFKFGGSSKRTGQDSP